MSIAVEAETMVEFPCVVLLQTFRVRAGIEWIPGD